MMPNSSRNHRLNFLVYFPSGPDWKPFMPFAGPKSQNFIGPSFPSKKNNYHGRFFYFKTGFIGDFIILMLGASLGCVMALTIFIGKVNRGLGYLCSCPYEYTIPNFYFQYFIAIFVIFMYL
jgi:hypothetical protein